MTTRLPSISKLTSLAKTATFRDTAVVFVGNLVSAILGAVFFFLLAHRVGPYEFGIFTVVLAISGTAVDLFDIGINNALVNFASKPEFRAAAIRVGITKKLQFSLLITVLLWMSAPFVSLLFGRPELTTPLRIGVWIVSAKSFFSFVKTILQTLRRFILDAVLEIVSAAVRLGVFLIPVSRSETLPLAFLAYSGSLAVTALVILPAIWPVIASRGKNENVSGFSSYQSWMSLAFLSSSISSRLDVFFLTRFVGIEAVGLYQAAFRLFMPIQQLAGSLSRVFAPRLASFKNRFEAHIYFRKSLLLTTALAGSMVLVTPILPLAIPLLFGMRFQGAVPIAFGLMPFFMVFLFSTPWWSVLLYYHGQAKKFAALSVAGLVLQLAAFPLAITAFGIHGAALALLATNVVLTVAVARWSTV